VPLAKDAIFAPVLPEPAELRIGFEPGQQIVHHGNDRVVSA